VTTQPWPFPQDTALDRARSIARSAIRALREVADDRADELEATAERFGESWVRPRPEPAGPEGLLSEAQLAARLGVRRSTVRNWVDRGVGPGASSGQGRKLTRYPGGFDPREADELRAYQRGYGQLAPPAPEPVAR
jgi:hypothetical protein